VEHEFWHINDGFARWSESSTALNTYMHTVKQLVCVGVVTAQDYCPLVHVPW